MSAIILIKANNEVIGAAQEYRFDNATGKGEIFRIRLDRARTSDVFGPHNYIHSRNQRRPLTIVFMENDDTDIAKFADIDGAGLRIVETVEDVWISDTDYTYQTTEWLIGNWVGFDAGGKTSNTC